MVDYTNYTALTQEKDVILPAIESAKELMGHWLEFRLQRPVCVPLQKICNRLCIEYNAHT